MKKNIIFLFILLTCVFSIVYAYTFDAKLDLNGDNAMYIELARNIASGKGYVTTNVFGAKPSDHFPPAYSAFLSGFIKMGMDNLILFKLLNGLFMFLSIAALAYMTSRLTKQTYMAFAIAALTIFSTPLLHFANIVMSEMMYMLFTVLGIVSLYFYEQEGKSKFWKSPWFYVAVLSSAAAYYTRTIGISIVFAVFVFFLFRKEWLAAVSSIVGFVLLYLPWAMRNSAAGLHSRYFGTVMTVNPWRPEEGSISTFGEFFHKMVINFDDTVLKGFREMLFPFVQYDYSEPSQFIGIIAGLAVLALVFYGVWHFGKMKWALTGFLLANIGVFLIWHGGNGSRYVTPITPFIFIAFYVGIYSLLERIFKWKLAEDNLKMLLLLIIILPMTSAVSQARELAQMPVPGAYQNYYDMAKYMNNNAKGAVICSRKSELFAYYAPNVYNTNYTYSLNADSVISGMVRDRVDFVILEQLGYGSTGRYLYPALVQNQELFTVVWQLQNPDTYLLRFNREAAIAKLNHQATKSANDSIAPPTSKSEK